MKITEVNYTDLLGRHFNGYDLVCELCKRGIDADQIVCNKQSNSQKVFALDIDKILDIQIRGFEREYSISNLIYPYADKMRNMISYKEADIVHYHLIHNGMFSLLDYPVLMNEKKCVWTIHDPWIITGNCVHPLDCDKWKTGCHDCKRIHDFYFNMEEDNTAFMWNMKRELFSKINPHIVVSSQFMKSYLQQSPITSHFDKIHIIPFGVDVNSYSTDYKCEIRNKFEIANEGTVIGFRIDRAPIKGNNYIFDALRKICCKEKIIIVCVCAGEIPDDIVELYRTINFGWVNDEEKMKNFYELTDLFLMPSLAESFGMMAIEAMAAGSLVLCFNNTVIEELIDAPRCGVAVEYKSADKMAETITYFINHKEELKGRGKLSREYVNKRYPFSKYIDEHIKLYEEIMKE